MTTLDWALENMTMIGDFVILVLSLPFNMFWSWWKPSDAGMETMVVEEDTPESESGESQPGVSSNGPGVQLRRRGSGKSNGTASSKIARPNVVPASRSDTAVNQVRDSRTYSYASIVQFCHRNRKYGVRL